MQIDLTPQRDRVYNTNASNSVLTTNTSIAHHASVEYFALYAKGKLFLPQTSHCGPTSIKQIFITTTRLAKEKVC